MYKYFYIYIYITYLFRFRVFFLIFRGHISKCEFDRAVGSDQSNSTNSVLAKIPALILTKKH